ncbi:hypothetical protein TNCV_2396881 [Trichonephila clavipes]|uniref:Uncharacterized protein n=1 Tax=Trichonephila clavipes TaxID=2585209 RepID=A0A8X6SVA3_TRICX|nr:hypothetical protein TNCV_2396881 [Trichonephila clavipes]
MASAWFLDHFTPSFLVPTDHVVSRVFIESRIRACSFHSFWNDRKVVRTRKQPGQANGCIHPKSHVLWLGETGQQPRDQTHRGQSFPRLSKALGFLGHGNIFVNECGNNSLCSSLRVKGTFS